MPSTSYDQTNPSWCIEAIPRQQKKWLSFLSLRFGTVLCTLTAVICFSWAMVQHDEGIVSTDGLGSAWSSINIGTSAYGFIWSTAYLIVIFCNCIVPPAASITFDCIAFIAQIIGVSFDLHELAYWNGGGYGLSRTTDDDVLYGVECFGCSVMLFGALIYLVLVVWASRACHVERKAGRRDFKPSFGA
ncbi:hypothetical protein N7467_002805 [Penicillium canescens]|nr:hypothetical protein N7467_002805 [Penicillium canescens]